MNAEARFDFSEPDQLQLAFAVHRDGGPRALFRAVYGAPGCTPTTRQVEDCAIEFYTAYNATFGRTF